MVEDRTAVSADAVGSTSDMSDQELETYLDRCTALLKDAVREYASG